MMSIASGPSCEAKLSVLGVNIYRANQNPNNGQCFWQPVGAVAPADLPANAIPIEPFAP